MSDSLFDIAIVGVAGRFPGAGNVDELWRNLCAGVESITHFSPGELTVPGAAELARDPNYVRARAIMADGDKFDAPFFGIHPKEAELIDPQQRIFLECCWHAFEDAGYDPLKYEGVAGVFAGCSPNSYFLEGVCADRGFISEYTAGYQVSNFVATLGANFEFLPTRVAYKLNLKGPAFSLNCGCSTSLVAICQACLALQNYQCDTALAGGVSVTFPQRRGYFYEPGGMVSPDGHCRTFDADAQGTVFGDGAGVVLLKRLDDAVADGDRIYAVIKGFGITNDGAVKVGFTAPGVDGQSKAIAMAHASGAIDPATIAFIEAHGTATPLGDPIEIAALTQAFRRRTNARQFCAIGSAKSNLGHLDVAAGVTGLIKAALSLHRRLLPPSLNFRRPNPELHLEDSPFFVNTALLPLVPSAAPLRAGVSAFGIGGTNAHIVLEEAPAPAAPARSTRAAHLLLLSARSASALDAASANLASHLAANAGSELADVAHTLAVGRHSFEVRRFAVAREGADAGRQLAGGGAGAALTRAVRTQRLVVAFMFPGQGAQHLGMGGQLYSSEPAFREQIDKCLAILRSDCDIDLRYAFGAAGGKEITSDQLNDTSLAQPALFAIEYALARFWMELGIRPASMIGHSVGEFVAACLAGVFTLEDGLRLVAARGRLMQALPRGAMLSVRLGEQRMSALINGSLSLAAVNGPSLTVVAGPDSEIAALEARLERESVACRRLRTSHAFHSSMMDPACAPFAELVASMRLGAPAIPFFSSMTGALIAESDATDSRYWANHLRQPVRFSPAVAELRTSECALLEVGPGDTLSLLARQHPAKDSDQLVIASLPDRSGKRSDQESILNALGQLWLHGADPDWTKLYSGEKRRRIGLPLYPFERKRYWIETRSRAESAAPQPVSSIDVAPDTSGSAAAETGASANHIDKEFRAGADTAPLARAAQSDSGSAGSSSMQSVPATDRRARIKSILHGIFQDLSGTDVSGASGSATFLELGFDSLFLTQVSQELQAKFHIKITFRQLLDQLATIEALAAHLDQNLPADAVSTPPAPAALATTAAPTAAAQAPAAAPQATVQAPAAPAPSAGVPAGSVAGLEAFFRAQMQALSDLMSKQLDVLRAMSTGTSASAPVEAPQPAIAQTPARQPAQTESAPAISAGPQPRKFLPFRPVDGSAAGELTPAQTQAFRALIERYSRRTAGSKRFTDEHRARLADPRVASGFRVQWKEIVYPLVTVRSKGSKIWDIDGNEYIDVVNGYGPIMFGHSPDFVTEAVSEQLKLGYETGPQSPLAGKVADLICEMTGMERVSFCNTGSEAVVAALRVARTITGRNRVVLFTGAYHGMFDEVVVKGVSGPTGLRSLPVAPGIPREKVANVTVLDYGTPEALAYIEAHAQELAAVLVEPVQSRHPALQPVEFLRQVRRITEQSGAALIFDEVVTGFRVHPGGCQALFGIRADLATYGKVLGGGLPIGIVAGRAAFMDALDGGMWKYGDDSFPETGVTFFAGTFVRHPLALAAAYAVLKHLKDTGPALQQDLADKTARMAADLNRFFEERQVPARTDCFGSIAYFSFPAELKYASLFYYYMRERGVHIQEGFPLFLTTAHTGADIARVIEAAKESIIEMQEAGFLPAISTSVAVEPHAALAAPARATDAPKIGEPRRAPLSQSQLEIWLSARLSDEASCCYNESITLKLSGELDHDALIDSVQRVIERHDALRARFSADGEYQEFAPSLTIEIPTEDLSALGADEREARMAEIVAEDARTPFDLTNGPLARARLIRLGPAEHHLIVTTHHIVCDGWSTNVILDELAKLYCARRSGAQPELPEPMQFEQYVSVEGADASRESRTAAERYWSEQFARPPSPLSLPTDRPRRASKDYAGATYRTRIDAAAYRRIKQAGAREKCTLFSTLLAGFQALLARLSGQSDIVIGIPTAGQSLAEGENLVGHCVNFLPVRGEIASDAPFSACLAQAKRSVIDAYEHQNCTYGTLIRKLDIAREPGRLPLLDVQFNLERVGTGVSFAGLGAEIESNPKSFVNFDLFLNIVESNDGLVLDCDYSSALFDESTIVRWLGHYAALLEAMARDAALPVGRLPLLTDADRRRLLVEWNQTARDFPRERLVHELFEEQARRTPNSIAAVFEGREVSYATLDHRSNQLAAHLRRLGVAPRSMIAIYVGRSIDMLIAVLGVLKAGCAYVPLDPIYPAERIQFILEETEAGVVVTQRALAGTLPAYAGRRVMLDSDWLQIGRERRHSQPSGAGADDLAYVIYTSGSTGRPKGVEISHRAVVNLLTSMSERPGFSAADTLLAVTTLAFDIAGLELLLPLITGGRVVIASRDTAAEGSRLRAEIEKSRATVMQATPTTWRLLLEAGWNGAPRLKMLCGGEALPRELAARLAATGGELWNMYGPTETTIWSATALLGDGDRVTIGRPIANTSFYILDSFGEPAPIGVPGELYIGGEGVARGYFKRPELNAEKFLVDPYRDGAGARMFRTGDLVRYLADGRVEFISRIDGQIKLRGYRIELGEIESLLAEHASVKEAAVALVTERPDDPRLAAYIVPSGPSGINPADLRALLRRRLPEYMVPSAFITLDELPRTQNGKLDRKALPSAEARDSAGERSYTEPTSAEERALCEIWAEVLNLDRVGIDDDIFELGGDSVHIYRIAARANKAGLRVEPLQMFEHRTVAEVVKRVLSGDRNGRPEQPRIASVTRPGRRATSG